MRRVNLSPGEDIDERALRGLIRTAYADIARRLEAETDVSTGNIANTPSGYIANTFRGWTGPR